MEVIAAYINWDSYLDETARFEKCNCVISNHLFHLFSLKIYMYYYISCLPDVVTIKDGSTQWNYDAQSLLQCDYTVMFWLLGQNHVLRASLYYELRLPRGGSLMLILHLNPGTKQRSLPQLHPTTIQPYYEFITMERKIIAVLGITGTQVRIQ